MYKIALIQNQLEMAHYGYADTRTFINQFKDSYRIDRLDLYTAHNIDRITKEMSKGTYDALIISSQAINDSVIRRFIYTDDFSNELKLFLDHGHGLLLFHQHRLAKNAIEDKDEKGILSFLPNDLNNVGACKADNNSYINGKLLLTSVGEKSFLMNCPNLIDIQKVQEKCIKNDSISGVYWHYWKNVNEGLWDILIKDEVDGNELPLVVVSKESTNARIVLSSLTLDWQEQKELFENILSYVLCGTSQIAVLNLDQSENINFQYLLDQLRFNKKTSFVKYNIKEENQCVDFKRAILNNHHSIVLLTEQSRMLVENDEIKNIINNNIKAGILKMIVIGDSSFTVYGRERDELRILYNLEMIVRGQIPNGYVDNSYLSTVDSLRSLTRISDAKTISKEELQNVLERILTHTKDGSYDGVFGATCPLLWLESRYSGKPKESAYTKKTLEWLINNKDKYGFEERAQLYNIMLDEQLFTSMFNKIAVENELLENIKSLDGSYNDIKEMEAIHLLHSLNYFKDVKRLMSFIPFLTKRQTSGLWIDVGITASIVIELIDSRKILLNSEIEGAKSFAREVNRIVFYATTAISKDKTAMETADRPWGKNISVNLLCIEALLKFDALIEMPVSEIVDSIYTYSKMETHKENLKTSLDVLSSVSSELTKEKHKNKQLTSDSTSQTQDFKEMSKVFNRARVFAIVGITASLIMLYFFIILAVYFNTSVSGSDVSFGKFFASQIGTHIGFVFGIAAVVPALVKVLFFYKKGNKK